MPQSRLWGEPLQGLGVGCSADALSSSTCAVNVLHTSSGGWGRGTARKSGCSLCEAVRQTITRQYCPVVSAGGAGDRGLTLQGAGTGFPGKALLKMEPKKRVSEPGLGVEETEAPRTEGPACCRGLGRQAVCEGRRGGRARARTHWTPHGTLWGALSSSLEAQG